MDLEFDSVNTPTIPQFTRQTSTEILGRLNSMPVSSSTLRLKNTKRISLNGMTMRSHRWLIRHSMNIIISVMTQRIHHEEWLSEKITIHQSDIGRAHV